MTAAKECPTILLSYDYDEPMRVLNERIGGRRESGQGSGARTMPNMYTKDSVSAKRVVCEVQGV